MKRFLESLEAFLKHPATQLTIGMILLISGGWEIVLDVTNAERTFQLGAHHGVALFGAIQVLGSLPELFRGIEHSMQAIKKRHKG